jgi:hypothetical protein
MLNTFLVKKIWERFYCFTLDQDGTTIPSWSCSKAVYKPVWHIPLLSVQWINSWWWTEELSETYRVSCRSKFGKLVHLVGFITKKFVTMQHGHMNVKNRHLRYECPDVGVLLLLLELYSRCIMLYCWWSLEQAAQILSTNGIELCVFSKCVGCSNWRPYFIVINAEPWYWIILTRCRRASDIAHSIWIDVRVLAAYVNNRFV